MNELVSTEAKIQAGIVRALRQLGWIVWESQKGSAGNGVVYCTPGIPDLFVMREGRGLTMLEVKRPKTGRVSEQQKARHSEAKLAGVPVFVVTSLDDVLGVLDEKVRVRA